MTAENLESALLITVPSAEPVVAAHRARFDSSAVLGIPAHVTVLVPFVPPSAIGPDVLGTLTRLFGTVRQFGFELDHTDWFGDRVLWLGLHDPAPFRALTQLVYAAFPDYPPYGGQFEDAVPHLTVGHRGSPQDLRSAEDSVRPHLPIAGHATAVALMTGPPVGGRWSTVATFPLAP